MLPSLVFSAIYAPIFYEWTGTTVFLINIINGCGHMWFLPMLFWCFIFEWLLIRVNIRDKWKLLALMALAILWPKTLPFQISFTFEYMFYFHLGWVLHKQSEQIKKMITPKVIFYSWFTFAATFVVFRTLREMCVASGDYGLNLIFFVTLWSNKLCHLLYATVGTIAFYVTILYYTQHHKLNHKIERLSYYCFAIYIFQQFIIKWLYYMTLLPSIINSYLLPWLIFIISLPLSYLSSLLFLRTRVGRYLLG